MGRPSKWYTVYLTDGDKLVAYGTAEHCARAMGITMGSFYCIVSRQGKPKYRKYEVLVEGVR